MESLLTLFVWRSHALFPCGITDFSVTEEAFDPVLNPLRAKSHWLARPERQRSGFNHKGAACS